MAQNQWVDINDDEDNWVDEWVDEPIVSPSVVAPPVNTPPAVSLQGPTQDDILREAATALTNTPQIPSAPVSEPPVDVPQAEPNWWDRLVSPLTDLPSRAAKVIADPLMEYGERENGLLNKAALYGGAFTQGLGDVATALTSPADVAAAALTGGGSMAARAGLRMAPKLIKAGQVASAIPMAHGAEAALNPFNDNTMAERGAGVIEGIAGAFGARGLLPGKTAVAGKVADDILPTADESARALLEMPPNAGNFNIRPDQPMPDLESYIITNNMDRAGKPLNPRAITELIGTSEVTNNAGEVIAQPLTAIRPILRPASNPDVAVQIGEAAVKNRPVPKSARVSPNEPIRMPPKPIPTGDPVADALTWKDYASLPRAIWSAFDISMPFRQGLGLIHTKGWWTAWGDMMKSVGSEDTYKALNQSIMERPNYVRGSSGKSFADEVGLQITDLGKLTTREEEIGSRLAERIPGVGRIIRGSNRAATAFMNKLRADNFDALIEQAEAAGLKPRENLVLARDLAKFVNRASGRGDFGGKSGELLDALNQTLFSPRLMASRMQMLNPRNYVMGNSMVRKQYLKSALALGTAWNGIAELNRLIPGGETNNDPTSSDFRQIKIGNTRIDPSGGFRPYVVLASRLAEVFEKDAERYSGKYGARTAKQDISEFIETKLSPVAAYAAGPWLGTEKFPHYVGDETVKLFTPIIVQDIFELLQEDPSALGYSVPANLIGMGSNTYAEGKKEDPRMTEPIWPKKYDLRFPRR